MNTAQCVIQTEQQTKVHKQNEQGCVNVVERRTVVSLGSQEGRRQCEDKKACFEEMIAEHFPNLMKGTNLHTQAAQQTSNSSVPRYPNKLLKIKEKVRTFQRQPPNGTHHIPNKKPRGPEPWPETSGPGGRSIQKVLGEQSCPPRIREGRRPTEIKTFSGEGKVELVTRRPAPKEARGDVLPPEGRGNLSHQGRRQSTWDSQIWASTH